MRKPMPLEVPFHLVKQAQLYAPTQHPLDAVCFVLEKYPQLVAETRHLRMRLSDFDEDSLMFDARLKALQRACQAILDL